MSILKLPPHPLLNVRPLTLAIWRAFGVPPLAEIAARRARDQQLMHAMRAQLDAQRGAK